MADEVPNTKTRRFSEMYKHDGDISAADALSHCSNFIGGSWNNLKQDDFKMSVIPCGFVNRIFLCENQSGDESIPNEPKKVILRLYGGKAIELDHIWRNGGIMEEVLVFYTMSSLGLGPKLLGVFPEGRLEQFVESRMFNNEDFLSPKMEALFARKLARMHVVKMPFGKQAKDLLDKIGFLMVDWLEHGKAELEAMDPGSGNEAFKKSALELDVLEEFEWLKSLKPKIKTRQVLAHGDMNRANCLVIENAENELDKLLLIDYEFANYGPRGLDIGAHFYNRLMDVAKVHEKFKSGIEYPTEQERRHFIRSYKDEMRTLNTYDLDESENGLDNEDNMLAEAEFWSLGFILFFRLVMTADMKKWAAMGFEQFNPFELLSESRDKFVEHKNAFIQHHLERMEGNSK